MKRVSLSVFLIIFLTHLGTSQNWNRLHMLDQEAEFLVINKQFEQAARTYLLILKELPGNYNVLFRIGYCYLNADGRLKEAISYFEKASQSIFHDPIIGSLREERAPSESYLLLGTAYQRNNQFDKAEEAYRKFWQSLPADDERHKLAKQHLSTIENAKNFMNKPKEFKKRNLGRIVNTNVSNVNAVISGDGQTMAYTNISDKGFEVFVAKKVRGEWGGGRSVSKQLRRDYLLTSGISFDGTELYLVYYLPDKSDIYVSRHDGREWSRARNSGSPVSSRSNETHASVSADGKTLYFTSNRDGGYGGLDIYKATQDSRGRWRNVENMGPVINTSFNEETPFITDDGRYLFFSSEGHNSMGGYDVFYIDIMNPAQVHNLGYPLNNADDNLFYFPIGDGREGYISFYDKDGYGQKDIYQVSFADTHTFIAGKEYVPEKADTLPDITELEDLIEDKLIADDIITERDVHEDTTMVNFHIGSESAISFSHREGFSYSIQFIALLETMNRDLMDTIAGTENFVEVEAGGFSRFVNGYEDSYSKASEALDGYFKKGYTDAFVRINKFVPNYTIQLMATENFLDTDYFSDFSDILLHKGKDGLYRVFWGRFLNYEEAASHISRIRDLGYDDAFIRNLYEYISMRNQ